MNLIAKVSILYLSRQYKPGDVLPAHDEDMVKLWLEHGSAEWDRSIENDKLDKKSKSEDLGETNSNELTSENIDLEESKEDDSVSEDSGDANLEKSDQVESNQKESDEDKSEFEDSKETDSNEVISEKSDQVESIEDKPKTIKGRNKGVK